jgi:hypothetical protein
LRLPCTTTLLDCHNSFSSSSFLHVDIDQSKSREFPSLSYNERKELGIQATSDTIKMLPNASYELNSTVSGSNNLGVEKSFNKTAEIPIARNERSDHSETNSSKDEVTH